MNVHKGRVPEYCGIPPGFWDLYENEKQAGVTIHFLDDRIFPSSPWRRSVMMR